MGDDGMQAKHQLVTANLRMVQGVVNLYIRNGLQAQFNAGDLMQEGAMALIRAAEKYEPQRGFRFSTYAMYWIRSAVKKSQTTQSRIVHVPSRLHETHKKIVSAEMSLKKELGRAATPSELAVAVGITPSQLERCVKGIEQKCFSLDADIDNTLKPNTFNSNKDSLYDILDKKYGYVDEDLHRSFMRKDLIDALRIYLTPHEADLILLRYGLMDNGERRGPLTIAQVSSLVGLKPDKVRRTINNSLARLRKEIGSEWINMDPVHV